MKLRLCFSGLLLAGGVPLLLARFPPAMTRGAAARFLDQSTWGATPADIAHLEAIGFPAWLNEQFAASPSPIPDVAADATTLDPVREAFLANAVNGPDQLRQRVAFALGEIWVVSNVKLKPPAIPPYLRLLANDAFGNYFTLMNDVTLSPAMGHYLDMVDNDKPASGQEANENYARELNQLFTIGTVTLNPDGTVMLDGSGQPIPTYDANVVGIQPRIHRLDLRAAAGRRIPQAQSRELGRPHGGGGIESRRRHEDSAQRANARGESDGGGRSAGRAGEHLQSPQRRAVRVPAAH